MSPLLLNANNPVGRARLAEVARIIRDGESLQLQFPVEDLGFRSVKRKPEFYRSAGVADVIFVEIHFK